MARGRRVYLRRPVEDDRAEFTALVAASRALHRPWMAPPATPRAYAAYMERCAAGDAQGCMDVARSIRGERTASKWWAKTPNAAARMSEELARAYEVELSRAQLQKVALLSLDRADALAIDVKLDLAKMAAEREEAARAWIVADDGQDMVVGGTIELQGATGDGRVILNYTPAPR